MRFLEVMNIQVSIVFLGVLVASRLPGLDSCLSDCAPSNETHKMVWTYYSKSLLDDKCKAMKKVATCASKPDFNQGCKGHDVVEVAKYKGFKALISEICGTQKNAYQRGEACFSGAEYSDKVKKCFEALSQALELEGCGGPYTNTRECFRKPMKDSKCAAEDSNLLAHFADMYLKPQSDASNCGWKDMEIGPLATPEMEPKVTPTSRPEADNAASEPESAGSSEDGSAGLAAPTRFMMGSLLILSFSLARLATL